MSFRQSKQARNGSPSTCQYSLSRLNQTEKTDWMYYSKGVKCMAHRPYLSHKGIPSSLPGYHWATESWGTGTGPATEFRAIAPQWTRPSVTGAKWGSAGPMPLLLDPDTFPGPLSLLLGPAACQAENGELWWVQAETEGKSVRIATAKTALLIEDPFRQIMF